MMSSVRLTFLLASVGLFECSRVHLEPNQRVEPPVDWQKAGLANGNDVIRLTFAVKHSNVDKLLEAFWDVSSPDSAKYGKFLSQDDLIALVRPSEQATTGVGDWLRSAGVDLARSCSWTRGREFLSCTLTCDKASSLLDVQWYRFKHSQLKSPVLRAGQHYSVPSAVAKYLDFVGGVHRFPDVACNHAQAVNSPDSIAQTPSTLRKLYGIDSTVGIADDKNIQSVVQFLGQHYSKTDLGEFFLLFGESFHHQKDIAKIIGPDHFPAGGEADLDVEYIMSIGANITTWFWSVKAEHESQEGFLTWLMQVANASSVPSVFSVSYGDDEDSLDVSYMNRVNQEFQKQALRGISILFASGDSGAGCHNGVFRPSYPASSPFVTAVGGTQGSALSSDVTGAFLSGGGFSNQFAEPTYQISAVDHFFSTAKDIPAAKLYNRSGRAYPDVSAMAINFMVVVDLIPQPVEGTSCAAPTFSGIISLVNDYLVRHGHSPLGFLNNFLYKNAQALTDITSGCQGGCGGVGFCCSAGWDPVTGIGAPSYPLLLKAALAAKEAHGEN